MSYTLSPGFTPAASAEPLYNFNGSMYMTTTNTSKIFNFTLSNFTIEFWYNQNQVTQSNNNPIMSYGNCCVVYMDGKGIAMYAGGGAPTMRYTINFINNTWYHIALVYSTTNGTSCYVDGQFISTINTPLFSSNTNCSATNLTSAQQLMIGNCNGIFLNKVYLFDFKIWNIALTSVQVSTGMGYTLPTTTGLILNCLMMPTYNGVCFDLASNTSMTVTAQNTGSISTPYALSTFTSTGRTTTTGTTTYTINYLNYYYSTTSATYNTPIAFVLPWSSN